MDINEGPHKNKVYAVNFRKFLNIFLLRKAEHEHYVF